MKITNEQPSEPNTGHKLVPALERGIKILDCVSKSKHKLNVSELARELGMAKSSAHGLCATLVELNLLVRKSDQTFQLGPHIMRWANRFAYQSDVATEFATIWDESTPLPGATITLSVMEGAEVVYIAARNSEVTNDYDFRIGMRLPAPFTATGKAFLSSMADHQVRKVIGKYFPDPLTSFSVQDHSSLQTELSLCRDRGYSFDNQQVKEGMLCYGALVLSAQNKPIAGVAVSLPLNEVTEDTEPAIIQSIQTIAKTISFRMGAEL